MSLFYGETTSNNAPTCGHCHTKMDAYDADRGWSCCNKKCPKNIAAKIEEDRYFKSVQLHKKYAPLLKGMSSCLFTVEEIGWINSRDSMDNGFELKALYERVKKHEMVGK